VTHQGKSLRSEQPADRKSEIDPGSEAAQKQYKQLEKNQRHGCHDLDGVCELWHILALE